MQSGAAAVKWGLEIATPGRSLSRYLILDKDWERRFIIACILFYVTGKMENDNRHTRFDQTLLLTVIGVFTVFAEVVFVE